MVLRRKSLVGLTPGAVFLVRLGTSWERACFPLGKSYQCITHIPRSQLGTSSFSNWLKIRPLVTKQKCQTLELCPIVLFLFSFEHFHLLITNILYFWTLLHLTLQCWSVISNFVIWNFVISNFVILNFVISIFVISNFVIWIYLKNFKIFAFTKRFYTEKSRKKLISALKCFFSRISCLGV